MVDVEGTVLTAHERARLRDPLVGGVILFARNFDHREQLAALCQAIHAERDDPLLIAVDHEGGRVQRFRTDGFTSIPAMSVFGALWSQDSLAAMRSEEPTSELPSPMRISYASFCLTTNTITHILPLNQPTLLFTLDHLLVTP